MGGGFILIHYFIHMCCATLCMLYVTILNKARSVPLFLFSLGSIIFIEQMQNFTSIGVLLFLTYLSGCFYRTMFLLILPNGHVSGSTVPEASVSLSSLFCGNIFFDWLSLNLVTSKVSSGSNQYEPTSFTCHSIGMVKLRGILCCQ